MRRGCAANAQQLPGLHHALSTAVDDAWSRPMAGAIFGGRRRRSGVARCWLQRAMRVAGDAWRPPAAAAETRGLLAALPTSARDARLPSSGGRTDSTMSVPHVTSGAAGIDGCSRRRSATCQSLILCRPRRGWVPIWRAINATF